MNERFVSCYGALQLTNNVDEGDEEAWSILNVHFVGLSISTNLCKLDGEGILSFDSYDHTDLVDIVFYSPIARRVIGRKCSSTLLSLPDVYISLYIYYSLLSYLILT